MLRVHIKHSIGDGGFVKETNCKILQRSGAPSKSCRMFSVETTCIIVAEVVASTIIIRIFFKFREKKDRSLTMLFVQHLKTSNLYATDNTTIIDRPRVVRWSYNYYNMYALPIHWLFVHDGLPYRWHFYAHK